jgi:hypothetical protein
MIRDLYRASVRVEEEQDEKRDIGCYLFAIKSTWQDEIILVANRSMIVEWPIALVETDCPEFKKLLRSARMVPKIAASLVKNTWSSIVIGVEDKNNLEECEEIEPVEEDVFSYQAASGIVLHFNRHYRGMVDAIWPAHIIDGEPSAAVDTKLCIRRGKKQEGLLIISENGRRRGAIANARV